MVTCFDLHWFILRPSMNTDPTLYGSFIQTHCGIPNAHKIFLKCCKTTCTSVGPKVSDLTYKSRVEWKILRRIYSAIYSEVNVSVCVEIKGDYIEK
jgi:hypothetical protein